MNLCVGSSWNATARSTQQTPTIQQKDELDCGRRAKKMYFRQEYGRIAGCPGCLGIGQHTEECRARIEQEMVDKGDAIIIEIGGEIALIGKFLEDELIAGREHELRNMLTFDAFDLVEELLPGKHACDMVWVEGWGGDRVRSRLCVAEELRDDFVCGNARHFFHKVFVGISSELQGLRNLCHWHFCCIHVRLNR